MCCHGCHATIFLSLLSSHIMLFIGHLAQQEKIVDIKQDTLVVTLVCVLCMTPYCGIEIRSPGCYSINRGDPGVPHHQPCQLALHFLLLHRLQGTKVFLWKTARESNKMTKHGKNEDFGSYASLQKLLHSKCYCKCYSNYFVSKCEHEKTLEKQN